MVAVTKPQFPKPGEKAKGQADLAAKSANVRRFYSIHYYSGMSDYDERYGEYVGLCCKSCNTWQPWHDDHCAVPVLEAKDAG